MHPISLWAFSSDSSGSPTLSDGEPTLLLVSSLGAVLGCRFSGQVVVARVA